MRKDQIEMNPKIQAALEEVLLSYEITEPIQASEMIVETTAKQEPINTQKPSIDHQNHATDFEIVQKISHNLGELRENILRQATEDDIQEIMELNNA